MQNMPKLAKSVQMRRKVPKYVATARRRRELAGYLSMVYTVYKGVGLGIGVVTADLHNTAQTVTDNITFHRSFSFNRNRFDYS